MSSLRTALAVNGVVFLVRAAMNLLRPTSFYADGAPTGPHQDAVRVIGISYATLGLIQLGATRADLQAVRSTVAALGLFAAGVAVQAATQGPGPDSSPAAIRRGRRKRCRCAAVRNVADPRSKANRLRASPRATARASAAIPCMCSTSPTKESRRRGRSRATSTDRTNSGLTDRTKGTAGSPPRPPRRVCP